MDWIASRDDSCTSWLCSGFVDLWIQSYIGERGIILELVVCCGFMDLWIQSYIGERGIILELVVLWIHGFVDSVIYWRERDYIGAGYAVDLSPQKISVSHKHLHKT